MLKCIFMLLKPRLNTSGSVCVCVYVCARACLGELLTLETVTLLGKNIWTIRCIWLPGSNKNKQHSISQKHPHKVLPLFVLSLFNHQDTYLQVPMTMHREQNMKIEDQQDATIRCLLLTSVSTCFGHHYVHLQGNKGPVTAFGVLFWFCWMWLVAVVLALRCRMRAL